MATHEHALLVPKCLQCVKGGGVTRIIVWPQLFCSSTRTLCCVIQTPLLPPAVALQPTCIETHATHLHTRMRVIFASAPTGSPGGRRRMGMEAGTPTRRTTPALRSTADPLADSPPLVPLPWESGTAHTHTALASAAAHQSSTPSSHLQPPAHATHHATSAEVARHNAVEEHAPWHDHHVHHEQPFVPPRSPIQPAASRHHHYDHHYDHDHIADVSRSREC